MTALRVAYLIDSLGGGGSERSLAELLPHLAGAGIEPRIFVLSEPDRGFAPLVRDRGFQVTALPRAAWWRRCLLLRRELLAWRPDLLHTALYASDVLGRVAAWRTGIPVLSSLVGVRYEAERFADPKIKNWRLRAVRLIDGWTGRNLTAHFHAVSEAARRSAIEHIGLAPEAVTVVRRGRDVDRFTAPSPERRAEARRARQIGDDEVLLVNVGRQTFHKAQLVLLEALLELIRGGLPVRLVIAGREGPYTAELAAFVHKHGLEKRVEIAGHVDDVPGLLAAADIFAFPSRLEGFPGAVLEALASGLPVVASDIPAIREIFPDPEDARLVTPDSSVELAAALRALVEDAAGRRALGNRGRELFLQRFDIRKTVPAMIDLYRRVAR